MAKKGVLLTDKDENFLYPQTILEMVTNKEQTATLDVLLQVLRENLESSIENTNLNVSNLRDELNALLTDETLSGEVRDAILELNSLLNSSSSDITSEVLTSIRQLKEDAVLHSEQSLTSSQKQQARKNVDAVGVVTTYGDGGSWATLSYNDNTIYPETKGKQVKMSNGSSVEDAINTNTSNISANTENIKEKIGLVGSPTVENGVQSGTLGYKNQPLFPTTRDNKVFVQSKSRTLDVVINDIETDISKEETRAQQVEMYLESQKADKYGYYENLSVGVADNLSGRGEATESEFAMRPSGGENKSIQDGTARINSIKGNSVVWNNLYTGNWYLANNISTPANVEKTEEGHIIFMPTSDNAGIIDTNISCKVIGDKCALYVLVNESESEIVNFGVFGYKVLDSSLTRSGKFVVYNALLERIESDYTILRASINAENNGKSAEIIEVKFTDITKMFNGVNVPTTIEEFESLYGNMPNEYNEGDIIDNHTTAIKSVGVNAWDEEWEIGAYGTYADNLSGGKISSTEHIRCKNLVRVIPNAKYEFSFNLINADNYIGFYDKNGSYLNKRFNVNSGRFVFTVPTNACYISFYVKNTTYNHDICIHLVHTGYLNGRYFPYESQTRQLPTIEGGLKSAGSAYDEIRYNKSKDKWEHVQRIGSVDLGTLGWYYSSSTQANSRFVQNSLLPNCAKAFFSKIPNIISNKYTSVSGSTWLNVLTTDKAIGTGENTIGGVVGQSAVVVDKQYTDVTTFKQALQGVILYYELAEPVVTELDVNISPDYKVWDYGTEEAISEVLSTPVRINANYGFNAVGQITDNTSLIEDLLKRVAQLEAQLAQQTNTVALEQDVVE